MPDQATTTNSASVLSKKRSDGRSVGSGGGGGASGCNTTAAVDSVDSATDGRRRQQQPKLRVAVGSSNPSKARAVRQALERLVDGGCGSTSSSTPTAPLSSSDKVGFDEFIDIQSFDVDSGVDHQPFGDAETKMGAVNRCRAAYQAYRKENNNVEPHLAFGMEGGLEWMEAASTSSLLSRQLPFFSIWQDEASEDSNKNDNAEAGGGKDEDELLCMAWMAVCGRRTGFVVDHLAAPGTDTYSGDKKPIYGLSKTAGFALPSEIANLVKNKGMELGDADDSVFRRVNSKRGSGTVGKLTKGVIDRSEYYEHALVLALAPWIRPNLYPHGIRC